MKHNYDSPVSLSCTFKARRRFEEGIIIDQILKEEFIEVTLHRYVLYHDSEPSCLIVCPKFFGRVLKVDLHNLGINNEIGHSIHRIRYLGREKVADNFLTQIAKVNEDYFKTILRFHSDVDISVLSCGAFQKEILTESQIRELNASEEFVYLKNYFALPIHSNCHGKVASSTKNLIKLTVEGHLNDFQDVKLIWNALKTNSSESINFEVCEFPKNILNKKVFKSDPTSKLKPSSNFIFVDSFGSLSSRTFKDYLFFISKYACKTQNKNFTPAELVRIFIRDSGIPLHFLGYTVESMLREEYLSDIKQDSLHLTSPLWYLMQRLSTVKDKMNVNYALVCLLPNPGNCIDYNFRELFENIRKETNLFEDIKGQQLSLSRFYLMPIDDLSPTSIDCSNFIGLLRNLSLLTNFERAIIVKEFALLHEFDFIQSRKLYCSLQNSGCDTKINYENFETIGDSALKLIVTFHLYLSTNCSEGEMTSRRTAIICNENLEILAKRLDLAIFIRVHKRRAKYFIPPNFSLDKKKLLDLKPGDKTKILGEQVIGGKVQADVVEAIIGAAFLRKNELLECLVVLREFKIISGYNFDARKSIFTQSLLIDKKLYKSFEKKLKTKKIGEKDSNYRIFSLLRKRVSRPSSITNAVSQNKTNLTFNLQYNLLDIIKKQPPNGIARRISDTVENYHLEDFQRRHLRYRFKNITYLKNALNHSSREFQRLEFLGDAVLEIFTLSNFYYIMKKLQSTITPEILHSVKLALLSTETLAKICRHFKIHRHFTDLKENDLKNINNYLLNYNKNLRFTELWFNSDSEAPKKMADGFEAVVGAVFLDSSWTGIKKFLGPVFCSFIYFFAMFRQTMIMDMKSEVINFFERRGIKAEFKAVNGEVNLEITRDGNTNILYKEKAGSIKISEFIICNKFCREQKWKDFDKSMAF